MPQVFCVGNVAAELEGTDLRNVRWCGVEVLHRLHLSVRNGAWGTEPGRVAELDVTEAAGSIVIRAMIEFDVGLSCSATYTLTNDALVASFEGTTYKSLDTNRVGWCLLHSLTQVGGTLHLPPKEHKETLGIRLPELVEPQRLAGPERPMPAWGPFQSMTIDANGARIAFEFVGDFFEVEDQRNWTDASFKTYSTPLLLPRPRRWKPGESISQSVSMRFLQSPDPGPRATADDLPPPRGAILSAIALPGSTARDLAGALKIVDRIRAEVKCDVGDEAAALTLISEVQATGVWDLTVLATDVTNWEALAAAVAAAPPEQILVLPADAGSGSLDETTSPALAASAEAAFGRRVGGGTRWSFAELQRHPLDHLAAISCSYSPTVHYQDERSVWESLDSYSAIVATARRRAPGVAFLVGPLRDGTRMSPQWVAASIDAWSAAGVDTVCALDVDDLSRDGRLTAWGEAIQALAATLAETDATRENHD